MAAAYLSKEPDGHTLQPTALVNEALLRILGQQHGQANGDGAAWHNREQFLGVAAICMRRVLVDHARARGVLAQAALPAAPRAETDLRPPEAPSPRPWQPRLCLCWTAKLQ